MKKILLICLLVTWQATTYSYSIGLKSRDNSNANIQRVEETTKISLPLVSFIFDPRDTNAYQTVADIPYILGKNRIYHITVSPGHFTAREIANGVADAQYIEFFSLVKSLGLRVVFRTMHEMNGGRYPRASNPEGFIAARKHVWRLSRDVGLTKENILFDMSVNGRDMPTRDARPSQSSSLIYCYPGQKYKLRCPTFEDYYPGDEYVDIMGFTFYNRGKGHANRQRQTPYQIIMHPQRKTLERIKKLEKPLFIDEVGTTSIWYDEHYSHEISQARFGKSSSIKRKNQRLAQLQDLLQQEDKIVGAIYFNVDLTFGMTNWQIGEADWSIFDPTTHMIYSGGLDLFNNAVDNTTAQSPLLDTFGLRRDMWGSSPVLVSKTYGKQAFTFLKSLSITPQTSTKERRAAFATYEKALKEKKITPSTRTKMLRIVREARQIVE